MQGFTGLVRAQFGADPRGNPVGEVHHAVQFRPLNHHPRKGLGARESHQHAARIAEGILGCAYFRGYGGQIFQTLAMLDANVYQTLRIHMNLLG